MAIIKIRCPKCGKETEANDERRFAFCTECGSRIAVKEEKETKKEESISSGMERSAEDLERGLQEVEFYYELSKEKNEMSFPEKKPEYYEKAQDVLMKLSQDFPSDYRVWWELSKPLDFSNPANTSDLKGEYGIGDKYFNKALDLAGLQEKRKLITEKDSYLNIKSKAIEDHKAKLAKIEEERRIKEEAEERERRRIAEEEAKERQRQEEEARLKKQAEQEILLRRQREEEAKKAEEKKNAEALKAAEKPVTIALVLNILAWISYPTVLLPYVFAGISINMLKNAKESKKRRLIKGIMISNIILLAILTILMIIILIAGAKAPK